jgi:hypothetical protein
LAASSSEIRCIGTVALVSTSDSPIGAAARSGGATGMVAVPVPGATTRSVAM